MKNYIYAMSLAGLMALTACDSDSPDLSKDKVDMSTIRIYASIDGGNSNSRVHDTFWDSGDVIDVRNVNNVFSKSYRFSYAGYNYDTDSYEWDPQDEYTVDVTNINFFAFYPPCDGTNSHKLDISDQTTYEKRSKADCLATDQAIKDGNSLKLNFKHKMAKIWLIFGFDEESGLDNSYIDDGAEYQNCKLIGIPNKVSFNIANYDLMGSTMGPCDVSRENVSTDSEKTIKFYIDKEGASPNAEIMIPPTPENGKDIVTFSFYLSNYKKYTGVFSGNFVAGTEYYFNVTIKETALEVSENTSITKWDDDKNVAWTVIN